MHTPILLQEMVLTKVVGLESERAGRYSIAVPARMTGSTTLATRLVATTQRSLGAALVRAGLYVQGTPAASA